MNNENRNMPTKFKIGISTITLLTVLIGFNQCIYKNSAVRKTKSHYGTSNLPTPNNSSISDTNEPRDLPDGVDMPSMNSNVTDSDLTLIAVGIKNFEQINATMSNITGIPTNNTNVAQVYNEIILQLPTDNNVKSFLPSMQVAITKLATEYCDRLIEVGTFKSTIWPTVNFSQSPQQTLTPQKRLDVVNQTIDYFLGPNDQTLVDQSRTELLALYDSLIMGENLTSNATTKKVLKGVCTAALSSAYVTLF